MGLLENCPLMTSTLIIYNVNLHHRFYFVPGRGGDGQHRMHSTDRLTGDLVTTLEDHRSARRHYVLYGAPVHASQRLRYLVLPSHKPGRMVTVSRVSLIPITFRSTWNKRASSGTSREPWLLSCNSNPEAIVALHRVYRNESSVSDAPPGGEC
jgi:hypothetical protein